MSVVSDTAHEGLGRPLGTSSLPRDLAPEKLAAAPVLASVDALLIDDLSEDEDEAFAAALSA
jgi:hypothetical protein